MKQLIPTLVILLLSGKAFGMAPLGIFHDLQLQVGDVMGTATLPLALPNTDTMAMVGAFAPGLPANGHIATIKFCTMVDVTGIEFSIGIKKLQVAVSQFDQDDLTTGKITFNAKPASKG